MFSLFFMYKANWGRCFFSSVLCLCSPAWAIWIGWMLCHVQNPAHIKAFLSPCRPFLSVPMRSGPKPSITTHQDNCGPVCKQNNEFTIDEYFIMPFASLCAFMFTHRLDELILVIHYNWFRWLEALLKWIPHVIWYLVVMHTSLSKHL